MDGKRLRHALRPDTFPEDVKIKIFKRTREEAYQRLYNGDNALFGQVYGGLSSFVQHEKVYCLILAHKSTQVHY